MIPQSAGADLRTLQILQYADRAAEVTSDLPKRGNHPSVVLMSAMRKVQARNIHAGEHQLTDHFLGRTCRTNRAHNLGLTLPVARLMRSRFVANICQFGLECIALRPQPRLGIPLIGLPSTISDGPRPARCLQGWCRTGGSKLKCLQARMTEDGASALNNFNCRRLDVVEPIL